MKAFHGDPKIKEKYRAIALLEDYIFENLPHEEAMQFPLQFLQAIDQAINIGANLNLVIPKFLVWLLTDPQYGVYQHANQQTKIIITKIALLYGKVIEGNIVDIVEWIAIADEAFAVAKEEAFAAIVANAAAKAAAFATYTAAFAAEVNTEVDAAAKAAAFATYTAAFAAEVNTAYEVVSAQKHKLLEILMAEV